MLFIRSLQLLFRTCFNIILSKDLYKAIGYMLSIQLVLIIGTLSTITENEIMATLLKISSVIITISIFILSIKSILKLESIQKLKHKIDIKLIITTLFGMVVSLVVISQIFNLFNIQAEEQSNQTAINNLVKDFPFIIIIVIILAPLIEEFVFRQLLPKLIIRAVHRNIQTPNNIQNTIIKYIGFTIPSLIFILLHTPSGIVGITSYTIMTIAFVYARLKHDNLITSILVHIIWNGFAISLTFIS